jgi:hypothetical protein
VSCPVRTPWAAPFAAGRLSFVSGNTFEMVDSTFSYTFDRQ